MNPQPEPPTPIPWDIAANLRALREAAVDPVWLGDVIAEAAEDCEMCGTAPDPQAAAALSHTLLRVNRDGALSA